MAIRILETGRFSRFILGDRDDDFYRTDPDLTEFVLLGGGADTLIVRENRQVIIGDTVFDQFLFQLQADQADTGDGEDTILMLAANGIILAGDGDDTITSSGDPDRVRRLDPLEIYGDDPSLTETEGHGDDLIFAGEVDEFIDGGGGTDTVSYLLSQSFVGVTLFEPDANGVSAGRATTANGGEDRLLRVENIIGSSSDDFIFGNSLSNQLEGGRGNDNIRGGGGNDSIEGNRGNDILAGEGGDDTVRGGNGRDEVSGGAGNDDLYGGRHNDIISTGRGFDVADGGRGIDTIDYAQAARSVFVNLAEGFATTRIGAVAEVDTLSRFENVIGSVFDDFIFGNAGANTIQGRAGRDQIAGLDGNDVIAGGSGADILLGNIGDDAVSGGNGADLIDGGFGDDFLVGNRGDDVMRGGPGEDTLNGGQGQDASLWFGADLTGVTDIVIGFQPLFDTLRFNGVFETDTRASDVIDAVNIGGGDTALVVDLRGSLIDDAPSFVQFATLQDFDASDVRIDLWQAIGAIEFV